jgi:predicted ATP-grasp superfamily ATP-dependent carboligase
VLLVTGPEPNLRWRRFCAELVERAERLGVTTVVTLGAVLADTAHTRPTPISGAAPDAEFAKKHGLAQGDYQGPTGITGVLQDACVQAGIPAVSVWAAVPHYVGQPPSPKASLALLRKVEDVLEMEIPVGVLPEQADQWQETVSELADEDEEISEYVRSLEEREDAELHVGEQAGEQIAAAFERYLRRRRSDED